MCDEPKSAELRKMSIHNIAQMFLLAPELVRRVDSGNAPLVCVWSANSDVMHM